MKVIGRIKIARFQERHANSRNALDNWVTLIESRDWGSFDELRRTFARASIVNGKVIFNIKGNSFRLVALIDFIHATVHVTDVLTHAEYDREVY